MKTCPNPECPAAERPRTSREYRDDATACADCGAPLVTASPPEAPDATPPIPVGRLAVTIVAPLLVAFLAPRVPLPSVDIARFAQMREMVGRDIPNPSAFALGLTPLLSAGILIELAALAVPRWRALRTGGREGRRRLTAAACRLAIVLAFAQALGLTLYLERMQALDGTLARLLVVLTVVASVCVLMIVCWVLDRVAFGGGLALLSTVWVLVEQTPLPAFPAPYPGEKGVGPAVVLSCLAAVALTAFVLRRAGAMADLPLPACGVLPAHWTAAMVIGAANYWDSGISARPMHLLGMDAETTFPIPALVITAGLGVVLGLLFNRPSHVAASGPGVARRVGPAVAISTVYVVILVALGFHVGRLLELYVFDLVPLVVATALVFDVVAEAVAVRRHGALVAVWPEHRLHAVDGALAALAREGVPAVARSVHQRALVHFFAPLIPIQIMVPLDRHGDAETILRAHFQGVPGEPMPAAMAAGA